MKMKKVLIKVLDRLDELYNRDSSTFGINTGFREVDDVLLGLKPSDLIVIAGESAVGKTMFATGILEHIANSQTNCVAYFSLKDPSENIVMEMLSTMTEIPLRNLQKGKLSKEDWKSIISTVSLIKNKAIHFFDSPTISINKISEKSKSIYDSEGLDLVIINDIQSLSFKETIDREAANSMIAHQLKLLAVELNIPIIVISQLDRDLENREDKRPILSDLRETGILAQLADVIMFIYRDEAYNEDSADKAITEIIIAKYRFGTTGTAKLSLSRYNRY